METEKVCSACGAVNKETAVFCKDCGVSFRHPSIKRAQTPYAEESQAIDGVDVSYYYAYLGDKGVGYMEKWRKMRQQGRRFSFNGVAFFFTFIWMFGKRMRRQAMLYLGIALMVQCLASVGFTLYLLPAIREFAAVEKVTQDQVVDAAEEVYGAYPYYAHQGENTDPDAQARVQLLMEKYRAYQAAEDELNRQEAPMFFITLGLNLLLSLLIGCLANSMYLRHVQKQIAQVRMISISPEEQRERLILRGSSSSMGYVAGIGVKLVYNVLAARVSTLITAAVILLAA